MSWNASASDVAGMANNNNYYYYYPFSNVHSFVDVSQSPCFDVKQLVEAQKKAMKRKAVGEKCRNQQA